MTSIIPPIIIMLQATFFVVILLALFLRLFSGDWTESSIKFKVTILFILAIATGSFMFSFISLIVFYPIYQVLSMFAFIAVCSAIIGSCCFGRLSIVQSRYDEVWEKYFKERNEWKKERNKQALNDEE